MEQDINGRRRPDGYQDMLAQAEAVSQTQSAMTRWRAIRAIALCDELDDAEARALIVQVIMAEKAGWSKGQPFCTMGTRLFCRLTGWSPSKVARVSGRLENGFWMFRHYTAQGHRAPEAAFDLRLLWAKIPDVENSIAERFALHQQRRHCVTLNSTETGTPVSNDEGQNTYIQKTKNESEDPGPPGNSGEARSSLIEIRSRPSSRLGHWLPISRTPTPRHEDAISMLSGVSEDFKTALANVSFNPRDPDSGELREAIVRLAGQVGVPVCDVAAALPRHGGLTVAAVLVISMNRSYPGYGGPVRVMNAAGWVRANLRREQTELDIWASVYQDLRLETRH